MATTNYRKAWLDFRATNDYKRAVDLLNSKGMKQPYIDNWLMSVFAAGWNATGTKIIIIDDEDKRDEKLLGRSQ
jgi:hypothetical protein